MKFAEPVARVVEEKESKTGKRKSAPGSARAASGKAPSRRNMKQVVQELSKSRSAKPPTVGKPKVEKPKVEEKPRGRASKKDGKDSSMPMATCLPCNLFCIGLEGLGWHVLRGKHVTDIVYDI